MLGAEVECRIGNAVYPAHYDVGWHITGTVGPFGAAAAVGKLLRLSEQQMVWALGLAATQPVGLREMFGTMTKSFHPGRAAQNGLTAALLASQELHQFQRRASRRRAAGPTCSARRATTPRSPRTSAAHFEISENSYKPFPCGVVIHPAIDGCIQLRKQYNLTRGEIERIELKVHPLVLELTGKKTPQTGPGRQVQRVSRGGRGDCRWHGRREAVQRPGGPQPGHRGAARTRDRRGGSARLPKTRCASL